MSKLYDEFKRYSQKTSGSNKSRSDRDSILSRIAEFFRHSNINIESINHIKIKHIELYVQTRLEQEINVRTICNEISPLRKVLKEAGRHQLLNHAALTNKSLGIAGGSRRGKKEPIPPHIFQEIVQLSMERDVGFAACLLLARALGLRAEEAVQACQSLKTWRRALEAGQEKLRVVFGTKGGRPRDTTIQNRKAVTDAVALALTVVSKRGGKLIDKPDLKSAMQYFHNQARSVGLTGKHSPHSLRYAFAHEAFAYYREKGFSEAETAALVSCDLGHGDGRGRQIRMVYKQSREPTA